MWLESCAKFGIALRFTNSRRSNHILRGYNTTMRDVIRIDSQILGGIPCFAGTRVPVRSLFDHLRLGYSVDEFLEQFPTVRKQQIESLLDEARHLFEETAAQPAT